MAFGDLLLAAHRKFLGRRRSSHTCHEMICIAVDVDGAVVIRKRVSRAKVLEFFSTLPCCLVGIEACPSAYHWSRQLQALGHTVRLMPPSYVKAYLKRSKNDANDAAARANNARSVAAG